jgi:hypothetical protein
MRHSVQHTVCTVRTTVVRPPAEGHFISLQSESETKKPLGKPRPVWKSRITQEPQCETLEYQCETLEPWWETLVSSRELLYASLHKRILTHEQDTYPSPATQILEVSLKLTGLGQRRTHTKAARGYGRSIACHGPITGNHLLKDPVVSLRSRQCGGPQRPQLLYKAAALRFIVL